MTATVLVVGASPTADTSLVAELWAGADAVLAADGGAGICLEAGVVPDAVVGDLDSLDPEVMRVLKGLRVPIHRHPEHKDESDLDLALTLAHERGADDVVVTGVTGGRLDHTLAALGVLGEHASLRPKVVDRDRCGWVLDKRGRSSLELAGTGATVSVFAMGGSARVRSRGLRWALDGVPLGQYSARGVSNEIEDDTATLRMRSGTLLVLSETVDGRPSAIAVDD